MMGSNEAAQLSTKRANDECDEAEKIPNSSNRLLGAFYHDRCRLGPVNPRSSATSVA